MEDVNIDPKAATALTNFYFYMMAIEYYVEVMRHALPVSLLEKQGWSKKLIKELKAKGLLKTQSFGPKNRPISGVVPGPNWPPLRDSVREGQPNGQGRGVQEKTEERAETP